MSEVIKNRYDFVILFDVKNGNPNGDPDAGNMPRVDPETNVGIITDVCIKRKIRNYVDTHKEGIPGYDMYVKSDSALNTKDEEAIGAVLGKSKDEAKTEKKGKNKKDNDENAVKLRDYMCKHYFDIRTFGAVITSFSKLNCGQVRGPVQMAFAQSIGPVFINDITITRQAVTTEKDSSEKSSNTMGRKSIIPYGLYRMNGFVSANLAQKTTGFSEEDLELLWEAILGMFEDDHSAARGEMAVRKLYIFKHDSVYGNAPSHKLFDLIKITPLKAVPRNYDDFEVCVDADDIPAGVTLDIRD